MNDYIELTEKSGDGADVLAATSKEIPALEGLLRRLRIQRQELVAHRYNAAQAVVAQGDKVFELATTIADDDVSGAEELDRRREAYRKVATTFLPYARKLDSEAHAWDKAEVRAAALAVIENPEV